MFKLQEEMDEFTQKYLMMTKRSRQKGMSEKEIKKDFEVELADVLCQTLFLANHNKVDIMKRIEEKWFVRLKD